MIRGSSSPFPDMRKGEERCAGSRVDAEYDFHSRASALDREIDILPIAHAQNQLVLQSKVATYSFFFVLLRVISILTATCKLMVRFLIELCVNTDRT